MRAVLTLLALAVSSCTFATCQEKQEFPDSSGNAFLRQCAIVETGAQTHIELDHEIACIGYVDGFVQGIQYLVALKKVAKPYCFPDEAENGQVIRILLKYVREHPERAHLPTGGLLLESLVQAYPCGR